MGLITPYRTNKNPNRILDLLTKVLLKALASWQGQPWQEGLGTRQPQLDAAQRILIRTPPTEGFETKLIASKASCTVRAVHRICLERQQSEMPTRRTARVGHYSCITSPMQKALCNILSERLYIY